MQTAGWVVLTASWVGWWFPFLFLVPHWQKRPSITSLGPTRIGLALECAAFVVAFHFRLPPGAPPAWGRVIAAAGFGVVASLVAWLAVRHLGRQFRVHAGLYEDHQLVTTGPYGIVRHPIYTSLLALLVCTLLVLARWAWMPVALAVFVAGTEIRVRSEDGLLAGRFGESFAAYRARVPAYLPFVR
jgi:protein-S-isoprenylcysteine O-methyltransferase Ste14